MEKEIWKITIKEVKMKYKVTNKLECPVKLGDLIFEPKETKILNFKPSSDRFHVEKLEESEKKRTVRRSKK